MIDVTYLRLLIENPPCQKQVNPNYPHGIFKILSPKIFEIAEIIA